MRMARFELYQRANETLVQFHCPGCGEGHAFRVAGGPGPVWTWNSLLDKATFAPSLKYTWDDPDTGRVLRLCHSYVRDGRIEYLPDCTHELAGKTVDVPEI